MSQPVCRPPLPARTRYFFPLALAGLGLLLAACTDEAAAPATAPPVLTVTVTGPVRSDIARSVSTAGTVHPWQEVSIGAEVGGYRLVELHADVGDRVRRGQVLARLDASILTADLRELEAAAAEAHATRAEAEANAERARSLKASGVLSAREADQLITGAATASARVQAAEARLAAGRLRLAFAEVRAPDDGVISARTANAGQVVGTDTELFRLIRRGRLEWRAEVQERDFVRMRPGLATTLDSVTGSTTGRIRAVSPAIGASTRVGIVYVDLPADTSLCAGMFATGHIAIDQTPGLTVPEKTLVQRDGFDYVFVLRPGDTVEQRRVDRGAVQGDQVEIVAGLAADDRIVVAGAGFLRNGDVVRVAPTAGDSR